MLIRLLIRLQNRLFHWRLAMPDHTPQDRARRLTVWRQYKENCRYLELVNAYKAADVDGAELRAAWREHVENLALIRAGLDPFDVARTRAEGAELPIEARTFRMTAAEYGTAFAEQYAADPYQYRN